mmetsp:Transcript_52169/g.86529  ORF Transcript_52169/g.86529 Transcript_52169/m.86529 type:complete len:132 (-) Transcript_52169:268-663(-)
MVCILLAAMCIVWLKLEDDYHYEEVTTAMFAIGLILIFGALWRLHRRLSIPPAELVHGDVYIRTGNGEGIDVANIALGRNPSQSQGMAGMASDESRAIPRRISDESRTMRGRCADEQHNGQTSLLNSGGEG